MSQKVTQDEKAWSAGYMAGSTGKPATANPYKFDGVMRLSWASGYIEGKARPGTIPQLRPIPKAD